MSTTNEANITAIVSIITACIAALPPIITSLTDLGIKLRSILKRERSLPPKILNINREALEERDWQKVFIILSFTNWLFRGFILFFIVNTIIHVMGFKPITFSSLNNIGVIGKVLGIKLNLIVIANFIFFTFYSIAISKAIRRLGKDREDSRFFLFKKAFIDLETDFESCIKYCQEILHLLGANVIEINSDIALIEAYTSRKLFSIFGGLYRIRITRDNSSQSNMSLEIDFFPIQFLPNKLIPYILDPIKWITKSSNINKFIILFFK